MSCVGGNLPGPPAAPRRRTGRTSRSLRPVAHPCAPQFERSAAAAALARTRWLLPPCQLGARPATMIAERRRRCSRSYPAYRGPAVCSPPWDVSVVDQCVNEWRSDVPSAPPEDRADPRDRSGGLCAHHRFLDRLIAHPEMSDAELTEAIHDLFGDPPGSIH